MIVYINCISPEFLEEQVIAVHQGICPNCSGSGLVDVHTSYRIWSALVLTSWASRPHICCIKCGRMKQIKDAIFSLLLSWWGFSWGLIVTPIQIIRNLVGMVKQPDSSQPSRKLRRLVLINIGMNLMQPRS